MYITFFSVSLSLSSTQHLDACKNYFTHFNVWMIRIHIRSQFVFDFLFASLLHALFKGSYDKWLFECNLSTDSAILNALIKVHEIVYSFIVMSNRGKKSVSVHDTRWQWRKWNKMNSDPNHIKKESFFVNVFIAVSAIHYWRMHTYTRMYARRARERGKI